MNVRKEKQGAPPTETQRNRLCRQEQHEEGETRKNKIMFNSCRKLISEENINREEAKLASDQPPSHNVL